ncbi:MAG: hypothetical protein R2844_05510 [Caldilineales bacterium]
MRKSSFAIFIVLVTLLGGCGDAVSGPSWSRSTGGRPTLTGDWLGEMPVSADRAAVLFVHLEAPPVIDGLNLTGSASYCIGGEAGEFEVWGNANRDGQVDDLRFVPQEDQPLWLLYYVSSRWTGDTLTLSGSYSYDPSRQHIARSDEPEPALALALQRGERATFEQRCAGANR